MTNTEAPDTSRLCVLLVCFAGAKRASQVRSELDKRLRSSGAVLLDEAVLKVNGEGKTQVYDPHRTLAGTLTPALTWGLFGLLAGGWMGLVIWAVVGALCGGLWAYYAEHIATKSQLKRIGGRLGPDTSALLLFAEAADAERLLVRDRSTRAGHRKCRRDRRRSLGEGLRRGRDPSRELGDQRRRNESETGARREHHVAQHAAAPLPRRARCQGGPERRPQGATATRPRSSSSSSRPRTASGGSQPDRGCRLMVKQGIIGWGVFGARGWRRSPASSATGASRLDRERRRRRRALGDLRPVRRRPLRPLGGARSVGPAAEEGRAADAARQLGHPGLGHRAPPRTVRSANWGRPIWRHSACVSTLSATARFSRSELDGGARASVIVR